MKLSLPRYRALLFVQFGLLLIDLAINSFCEFLRFESVLLLVLFIFQDVCLVFALIIVFLSFFSTYVFQAGLVGVLFEQFRTTIFVCVAYIGLSISYHVWSLNHRWKDPMTLWWTTGLQALYVCQRFTSAFYYYYYKRTALMISDPKFYEDISWLGDRLKFR